MKAIDLKELLAENKTLTGSGKGHRVMLYSHDTLGLGHLRRNLKIARALRLAYPDIGVRLATGSPAMPDIQFPDGVDYVELPAVKKIGIGEYDSRTSGMSFDQTLKTRREILLTAVKDYAPHIFVVDHSPLGMKGDVIPALQWLAENSNSSLILIGLRDIIDDPGSIRDSWRRDGIYDILRNTYHYLMVYGEKEIYDMTKSYAFPDDLKSKTIFTGYVAENNPDYSFTSDSSRTAQDQDLVMVTIGGGEWMGQTIIGNYLKMLEKYREQISFESVVITGPFIPDEQWKLFDKKSAYLPLQIIRFIPETRPLIEKSAMVISTAGYNAVVDLLSYGSKALIIPRVKFRQEQLIRAQILSGIGLFDYIHPDEVTPDKLYEEINRILNSSDKTLKSNRTNNSINLYGAENAAKIIGSLAYSTADLKGKS